MHLKLGIGKNPAVQSDLMPPDKTPPASPVGQSPWLSESRFANPRLPVTLNPRNTRADDSFGWYFPLNVSCNGKHDNKPPDAAW